jgi:oxygen-independent coproporphyrinogen-3 oxidase
VINIRSAQQFIRLYIHVPFCASKCGYCAFYSEPSPSAELRKAYISRLAKDIARRAPECAPLKSLFIGGGNPAFLSAGELEDIFSRVRKNFSFEPGAEITVECNPESVDGEKAGVIAGFANRVSLGAQSFSDQNRRFLERAGDAAAIPRAFEALLSAGLSDVSLDMIYGLPGQTPREWEADLDRALGLGPRHISAYELSVDEGSRFAAKFKTLGNDDGRAADMWRITGEKLAAAGLPRYEISNYAAPGFERRHNLDIWFGGTYLGLGPAAASFDGLVRRANVSSLEKWLAGAPEEEDIIPPEARAKEIFIMGLRTTQGWGKEPFQKLTGFDCSPWLKSLRESLPPEMFEDSPETFRLTDNGLLVWNSAAEFILA